MTLPPPPPSTQSAPYVLTSLFAGMCNGPLLLVTDDGDVDDVPDATVLPAMAGVVEGDGDDFICDKGNVGGGGGSSYSDPPPFIMLHQLPPGHPAGATSCSP